jgi:hypothetical protein
VKNLSVFPKSKPYDRVKAVNYAIKWALQHNPKFYDYSNLGGDCTNFASQVVFAGAGVMNFTRVYGWYYINGNEKSPSWTGVDYLYQFLVNNRSQGPFAENSNISAIQPGDLIQLSFGNQPHFNHSLAVTRLTLPPTMDNIDVATHTPDSLHRKLSSYHWVAIRFIHILGVHL